MRLAGQVALITGGAQGIGLAYARRFAREGSSVVIADINAEETARAAGVLRDEGGNVTGVAADVTDESQMRRAVDVAISTYGRIDTLVNNAALYGDLDFRDQSIEYLERVLRVNMIGALVAARAAFPNMKAQQSGSVINIASTAAYEFVTQDGLERDHDTIPSFQYSLSKAGVISLTKFMAGAIGKYGIRVNCLCPGMTLSETTRRLLPADLIEGHLRAAAMQHVLDPEDLTGTAVFLASEDSRLITGQVILVDAGLIMPA